MVGNHSSRLDLVCFFTALVFLIEFMKANIFPSCSMTLQTISSQLSQAIALQAGDNHDLVIIMAVAIDTPVDLEI